MYGIYINCRKYPFIRWILSGRKISETRACDVLRNLVGKRVYLIETGRGVPMVRGIATITESARIPFSDVSARRSACIIGTDYDIQQGGEKVFYRLRDVKPVRPFPVPSSRVNHGRSFTEF